MTANKWDLFDVPARRLHRPSDPEPAREGAEEVTAAGRAKVQRILCLELCKLAPGLHSKQYDVWMGVTEVARKRFPELRAAGLVYAMKRVAYDLGRNVQHWYPTHKA